MTYGVFFRDAVLVPQACKKCWNLFSCYWGPTSWVATRSLAAPNPSGSLSWQHCWPRSLATSQQAGRQAFYFSHHQWRSWCHHLVVQFIGEELLFTRAYDKVESSFSGLFLGFGLTVSEDKTCPAPKPQQLFAQNTRAITLFLSTPRTEPARKQFLDKPSTFCFLSF